MNYKIPKDPNMLLSYINMMLRDRYPSLEEFCIVNEADIDEIKDKLRAAGYQYVDKLNQFKYKEDGDMMKKEALEVLKNRRAIRKYKADQITDAELDAVVEAGTFAPTGAGTQGVQIVVVQSPEYVVKVDALNAKVIGKDIHPYYGAPTIILVFETPECFTHELDGAAVCTNMLNAAYAAGLGSCWIHRCKQMFEMEEGKELLKEWGLPENLVGVASMALGYADCDQPQPKPRKEGYVVRV